MVTPDEPRPVRLMNTIRADRSGVHDDLTTVEDLSAWLTGEPATAEDLAAFRTLRQGLRDLAALLTDDTRAIAADRDRDRAVAAVNAAVRQAVAWPQLDVEAGELRRRTTADAPAATRVLAATAAEAVDLFTGPDRGLLRACYAPGCVLYFVKDHPRREWCSPGCGNRVRAARHYRRNRTDG
ncbi:MULTISPECIES: CGNR zinc finger domain-containing protein [unclassified Saccharothrix]|uniref:CGNR zinc finger domain-containing protein n=1 Tax=unclassified Saccharothrix TaxID=2593673 RepID=UPI00307E2720